MNRTEGDDIDWMVSDLQKAITGKKLTDSHLFFFLLLYSKELCGLCSLKNFIFDGCLPERNVSVMLLNDRELTVFPSES